MSSSPLLVALSDAARYLHQTEAHVRRLCALDHLTWWIATDAIDGRREILVTLASLERWAQARRKGRSVYRVGRRLRGRQDVPGRVIDIGIRPIVSEVAL